MRYRVKIHRPIFGVPITFLDKHNPNQFDITYLAASHGKEPKGIENEAGYMNGKWVYARIFVRQKEQTHEVQS